MMAEDTLREELVRTLRQLSARGLNRGTSGNASVRCGSGMLVTPTGIVPDQLTPQSMVLIDAQGECAPGALRPSSEWRMHWGILSRRPDVRAVIHCHSHHATTLACAGKTVPSLHYMVTVSGRAEIPLTPYHPFGSKKLATTVMDTLQNGCAYLMANHGQIVATTSLTHALAITKKVEEQ